MATANEFIGAVIDATHHNVKDNVCQGMHQSVKECDHNITAVTLCYCLCIS